MTKETLKHVKANRKIFEFWIGRNEKLQHSMDILAPIIPEFTEAHPEMNVLSCQSCLIDMLVWAIVELKESEGEKSAADKIKDNKK